MTGQTVLKNAGGWEGVRGYMDEKAEKATLVLKIALQKLDTGTHLTKGSASQHKTFGGNLFALNAIQTITT
jgi:hypothetical protein